MTGLGRELGAAGRRLVGAPGTTVALVLTLALGAGANIAVFGLLEPLVLRALPVADPGALVLLHSAGTLGPTDAAERATADYDATRPDLFAAVGWDAGLVDSTVDDAGTPTAVRRDTVSPNYFALLGLTPVAGRLSIGPAEASRLTTVVLDETCWARVFHRDPAIVGRTITVDREAALVIGVAPAAFFGLTVGDRSDLYVSGGPTAGPTWVHAIARLAPGQSPVSVTAALLPTFDRVAGTALPEVERLQEMSRPVVTPLAYGLGDRRDPLVRPAWALMAMVALLLLVASANVASVLTARQLGRRTEIAIRRALGADRTAAALPGALEGLLVAGLGAGSGLLIGTVMTAWLRAVVLATYGLTLEPHLSVGLVAVVVAFFAVAVALATLGPALLAGRRDVRNELGGGRGATSAAPRGRRWQVALVGAQLGASVTLLGTAGLLVHSLVNLETTSPGFEAERVIGVALADARADRSGAEAGRYVDALVAGARELPGVQAAGLATIAPFSGEVIGINVATLPVGPTDEVRSEKAFFTAVTPGYFLTLGLGLRVGRVFTEADDSVQTPAIVLNETLAHRLFGPRAPIGRRVRFVEGQRPPMTIVGVVADSRYLDLRERATSFAYTLRPRQLPSPGPIRGTLFVRTEPGVPSRLDPALRHLVSGLDQTVTVRSLETLRASVDRSLAVDRAIAGLSALLGALALGVAALGLFGMLSVVIAGRTREIGLRMALGSTRGRVVRLVGQTVVGLVATGLTVGALGTALARALLGSQLFEVPTVDVVTALAVSGALMLTAAVASARPVWAAASVDPASVLRKE